MNKCVDRDDLYLFSWKVVEYGIKRKGEERRIFIKSVDGMEKNCSLINVVC